MLLYTSIYCNSISLFIFYIVRLLQYILLQLCATKPANLVPTEQPHLILRRFRAGVPRLRSRPVGGRGVMLGLAAVFHEDHEDEGHQYLEKTLVFSAQNSGGLVFQKTLNVEKIKTKQKKNDW